MFRLYACSACIASPPCNSGGSTESIDAMVARGRQVSLFENFDVLTGQVLSQSKEKITLLF